MEASESLSIESFSYSWLLNLKPSFEASFRASFDDAFDDSDSNFIEMDPKLSASKRFLVFHQDFDFDLPTLQPCVHADELISNGILVPLFLKDIGIGIYDSVSRSTQASPVSSSTSGGRSSSHRSLFSRRYPRLPKRVVRKYLKLVRLIWLRMKRGKSDSNSDSEPDPDSDSGPNVGIRMTRSWDSDSAKMLGFEGTLSPRVSEADNWRRSCDSESSIYEAVLHCKKTIGCK
ncbi:hypothetical protein LXL04_021625 [Taraxacum kok-saghyz]